jgi:hypothetical protein
MKTCQEARKLKVWHRKGMEMALQRYSLLQYDAMLLHKYCSPPSSKLPPHSRSVSVYSAQRALILPLLVMHLSLQQFILVISTLDATLSLALPIPQATSGLVLGVGTREIDTQDVQAREPAVHGSVSGVDLEERGLGGAVANVVKVIVDVVSNIKNSIAADKDVSGSFILCAHESNPSILLFFFCIAAWQVHHRLSQPDARQGSKA